MFPDRIVLDSDAYDDPLDTLRALDNAHRAHGHLPIGDLVWAQLLHWRDVVAQGFDGHDMAPFLRGVRRIEVESCGERRSSEAWLMAGWLSARLTVVGSLPPETTITARHDEHIAVGDLLAVRLHCELDGRAADVSVESSGGMTVTRIATSDGMQATRTMATQTPDAHALLGRELQESGEDRTYIEALRRATELAARR